MDQDRIDALLAQAEEATAQTVILKSAPGDPAYIEAERLWAEYDEARGIPYEE